MAGLALGITGCAAATPSTADEGTDIVSIEGDWVLIRGVSEASDGSGLQVGERETLSVAIGASGCTATSCLGTLVATDESGAPPMTAPYQWDGTILSWDEMPGSIDCVDSHGKVLLVAAYTGSSMTELTATDDRASAFEGTTTVEVRASDGTGDQLDELGCPSGGSVEYKVRVDRAT